MRIVIGGFTMCDRKRLVDWQLSSVNYRRTAQPTACLLSWLYLRQTGSSLEMLVRRSSCCFHCPAGRRMLSECHSVNQQFAYNNEMQLYIKLNAYKHHIVGGPPHRPYPESSRFPNPSSMNLARNVQKERPPQKSTPCPHKKVPLNSWR